MTKQKTYKREVAGVMLFSLAALTVAGIAWPTSLAWEVAKFYATPVFVFAGGAFGLDAISKQVRD